LRKRTIRDGVSFFQPNTRSACPSILLRLYAKEDMKSWQVSDKVGNYRNNWAELIEPIPETQPPKDEKASKRARPKKEPSPKKLFD
jgi:hypothetical protein